ncbi:MAG: NMD3-related protein [Nanoarchaeota archaeon]|nr:NMD3-related protein [Nanoarchaeota archaeon]
METHDKSPQYFQGILQLRNPNEEVINFIANQLKKNEKVWVAKQVKLKTGIDLYVSSNKFLMALGKKLKKSFKGELKTSRKLHTKHRLTSKNVYRVTVCYRVENIGN